MMCWCEMVGQAWGNCVSRGEEQAGSFCFSYNAPSYTSYNALKNCWCWFFAVVESVLVQPSTCSPECYHGLHIVHCSIMCNAVQCSVVQCSAVELLIYIGGAPADSLVRGRGKGAWDNTLCGNFDKYIFYLDKYYMQLWKIHVDEYSCLQIFIVNLGSSNWCRHAKSIKNSTSAPFQLKKQKHKNCVNPTIFKFATKQRDFLSNLQKLHLFCVFTKHTHILDETLVHRP